MLYPILRIVPVVYVRLRARSEPFCPTSVIAQQKDMLHVQPIFIEREWQCNLIAQSSRNHIFLEHLFLYELRHWIVQVYYLNSCFSKTLFSSIPPCHKIFRVFLQILNDSSPAVNQIQDMLLNVICVILITRNNPIIRMHRKSKWHFQFHLLNNLHRVLMYFKLGINVYRIVIFPLKVFGGVPFDILVHVLVMWKFIRFCGYLV